MADDSLLCESVFVTSVRAVGELTGSTVWRQGLTQFSRNRAVGEDDDAFVTLANRYGCSVVESSPDTVGAVEDGGVS